MKEKERMIKGEIYNPIDIQLIMDRNHANKVCSKYNKKYLSEFNFRNKRMKKLLNTEGAFWIKPPFSCDYGYNIYLEKNVLINYGCVFLDVCPIRIGENTLIGPNVQLYTACHSLDPEERKENKEYGKLITIGKNVWIGGSSIVLPGITIGDNTVIGAGSVVTKSLPSNVIAVGNPCKIVKKVI